MLTVRLLKKSDEAAAENFLSRHARTTMFMRSNLRRAGVDYAEKTYHGNYYGAFDEDGNGGKAALQGVLAHYWNHNLMMQAADHTALGALIEHFKREAKRPVGGILGDLEQTAYAISALKIAEGDFAINESEGLYDLDLADLKIPTQYDDARHKIVPARDIGAALLTDWITAYDIEALGAEKGSQLEKSVSTDVENTIKGDNRWALLDNGTPVALCGFNAELPDIVQIGPVWTPPEHRGNGYARLVLALSLAQAQKERGIRKSILFTDTPAAIKAYESIGFVRNGSYRIALLKKPVMC